PSSYVARWIHSSANAYDGFNKLTRPALNAGLVLILLLDAALLGGITIAAGITNPSANKADWGAQNITSGDVDAQGRLWFRVNTGTKVVSGTTYPISYGYVDLNNPTQVVFAGAMNLTGTGLPNNFSMPDMTYNPADGLFYMVRVDNVTGVTTLYTYNPTTNVIDQANATAVGNTGLTLGTTSQFVAMMADVNGNVFGFDNVTGTVYQFNTSTGAATVVGTAAPNPGDFAADSTKVNLLSVPYLYLDMNESSGVAIGDYSGNFAQNFVAGSNAVVIADSDLNVVDITSTNLQQATITLTNAKSGDVIFIDGALPAGITATTDASVAGVITITLSGVASEASYEAALKLLKFYNTAQNPDLEPREITWQLMDDYNPDGNSSTRDGNVSVPAITILTIADDPLDNNDSVSVDSTASGAYQWYDVDAGDSHTFTAVLSASSPNYGTFTINNLGQWAFDPNETNPILAALPKGQTIVVSYDITVTDALGATATRTQEITIYGNKATTPPVVLDLNGNGELEYTHIVADVNEDGTLDATAWVGSGDGILMWDQYGDGMMHHQSQYALGGSGLTDLQALALNFDTNRDSVFDANDELFSQFGAWQDINQDGVTQAGEFQTLSELGIQAINLVSDGNIQSPTQGVFEYGQTTAVLESGNSMLLADVSLIYQVHTPVL
ncbi:MAG: VCBS domain-containing protein, partial [Burkholderiales bacterium]|nr:VCBS domain-containing protein [Burkholderiales bacterium]